MIVRDLRLQDPDAIRAAADALGQSKASEAGGAIVTAWQAFPALAGAQSQALAAVAPDFLNYARMLNTGQAAAMLKLSGSASRAAAAGVRAAACAMRSPLSAAKKDFWVVARALLAYDLALLPKNFGGPVLLHSYLADFAVVFDKTAFFDSFFGGVPQTRQKGVWTQQLPAALSALAQRGLAPDIVVFPMPWQPAAVRGLVKSARNAPAFAKTRFWGDVSSFPVSWQDAVVKSLQREEWLDAVVTR